MTWICPKPNDLGTLKIIGRIPPREPIKVLLSREKVEFKGTADEYSTAAEIQKIKNTLDEGWQATKVIASKVHLPASTVRRNLNNLFDSAQILRKGEGKKNSSHMWKRNVANTAGSLNGLS